MAGRSLPERISRLERHSVAAPAYVLSKAERDALVPQWLAEGDPAAILARETRPFGRSPIEAAFRADR